MICVWVDRVVIAPTWSDGRRNLRRQPSCARPRPSCGPAPPDSISESTSTCERSDIDRSIGQHSIRTNGQWRGCFRFADSDAFAVEISRLLLRTRGHGQQVAGNSSRRIPRRILSEIGVSQAEFARAVVVSAMRVSHVVAGARPITADLALRFGKVLGQSPEYWLNLQAAYDLATARNALGGKLASVRPLPQVA